MAAAVFERIDTKAIQQIQQHQQQQMPFRLFSLIKQRERESEELKSLTLCVGRKVFFDSLSRTLTPSPSHSLCLFFARYYLNVMLGSHHRLHSFVFIRIFIWRRGKRIRHKEPELTDIAGPFRNADNVIFSFCLNVTLANSKMVNKYL